MALDGAGLMLLVDVPEHTLDIQMHDGDPNPEHDSDCVMGEDPGLRQAIPASPALDLLAGRVHHDTVVRTVPSTFAAQPHSPPKALRRADSAVGLNYDSPPPNTPTAPRARKRRILAPVVPGLSKSKFAPPALYPDYYRPKREAIAELTTCMADLDVQRDRRGGGGYGGNPRKRRFREDDEAAYPDDRRRDRPQRRRYEEPAVARLRKGLINIAESVSIFFRLALERC